MPTHTIDAEFERYKDWDMQDAQLANTHPMVKKLQDNMRAAQSTPALNNLLDEDVTNWLVQQTPMTKRHVNALIRHAIAMQGEAFA